MPTYRGRVASTVIAAAVAAAVAAGWSPAPGGAQTAAGPDVAAQQRAVVGHNHQGPITSALSAIAGLSAQLQADEATASAARTAASDATGQLERAIARLAGDRSALAGAQATVATDGQRLGLDRSRLRLIATAAYTGALAQPDPSSLQALGPGQQRFIELAEVDVISRVVDGQYHADRLALGVDQARRDRLLHLVAVDRSAAATALATASNQEAIAAVAARAVTADGQHLVVAHAALVSAQAQLAAALRAVAGPASIPGGQLSLLGGAALDADQLVAWYRYEGYVDLTPAPIDDLARWYIADGQAEGVRGDVAFAQAVLETGGFSSPDAAGLNNYAGIGHCDSCAAGWAFPSPAGGALGHVQLLRIFATTAPAPAGSPKPVLPSLTTAKEPRAGCCASVQSLTGVWASDPTYGTQILGIYQQMLDYVLAGSPPTA